MATLKKILNTGILTAGLAGLVSGCAWDKHENIKNKIDTYTPEEDSYNVREDTAWGDIDGDGKLDRIVAIYSVHTKIDGKGDVFAYLHGDASDENRIKIGAFSTPPNCKVSVHAGKNQDSSVGKNQDKKADVFVIVSYENRGRWLTVVHTFTNFVNNGDYIFIESSTDRK